MNANFSGAVDDFRREYAVQRAAEGRAHRGAELLALPYLRSGPLARQWAVRARTFDAFMAHVVRPMAARPGTPLRIADLGAGNGWLSYRLAQAGHHCTAIDLREDAIDGLGVATFFPDDARFKRVIASFDDLPLADAHVDLAVFNASLHYATDLRRTLAEARRIVAEGGLIAILDSPFYESEEDGRAMVAEKHRAARRDFGERADALLALPFVEFLTRERLAAASDGLELSWTRRRVRYPLWYELRGLKARLRGRRAPSRFDVWTAAA